MGEDWGSEGERLTGDPPSAETAQIETDAMMELEI